MRREADELRNKLGDRGISTIVNTCPGGEVFAYYPKKGTVIVQGDTSTELSRDIEAWATGDGPEERSEMAHTSKMAGPSEQIFIVYGHDTHARRDLQLLLHQMGLKPIVLGDLRAEGDTHERADRLARFGAERSPKHTATHSSPTPPSSGQPST